MDRVLRVRLRHGQRQEVANTLPIVRVRLSQGGRMGGGGVVLVGGVAEVIKNRLAA